MPPWTPDGGLGDLDRIEPTVPMDGGGNTANPNVPAGPTLIGINLQRDEFEFEAPPLEEPPDFEAQTISRRKRGSVKPKINKPRVSGINL